MMVNDAGSVGLNSYLHEAPHQFVSYIELLQQKKLGTPNSASNA